MANQDLNTNYFMQQYSRRYNSDLFEFRTKTAAVAGRTFDCGLCSSTILYMYLICIRYYTVVMGLGWLGNFEKKSE